MKTKTIPLDKVTLEILLNWIEKGAINTDELQQIFYDSRQHWSKEEILEEGLRIIGIVCRKDCYAPKTLGFCHYHNQQQQNEDGNN